MGYGVIEVAKAGSERITQLDTIANNLANSATPGFKVENFYPGAQGGGAAGEEPIALQSTVATDYSQGMLRETGNILDLAIEGEGFFTVQTSDGAVYTRKGSFALNREGQMVTMSGEPVMGENGPIKLESRDFSIDRGGRVTVDGTQIAKLRIVSFENPQALTRTKGGMFSDPGSAGAKAIANPEIKPRSLELSNVNIVKEMAEMINVQRSFESYQKVIQSIADLDKLAVSRIGRIA